MALAGAAGIEALNPSTSCQGAVDISGWIMTDVEWLHAYSANLTAAHLGSRALRNVPRPVLRPTSTGAARLMLQAARISPAVEVRTGEFAQSRAMTVCFRSRILQELQFRSSI